MSGHRDRKSGSPKNEPTTTAAPVKAGDAAPSHLDADAAESWDNEGGHDRTAAAERPSASALPDPDPDPGP
jgi:hypothetical protein